MREWRERSHLESAVAARRKRVSVVLFLVPGNAPARAEVEPVVPVASAISQSRFPRLGASQTMIGTQLNHYRIVSLLGEGGMGAVYRAEDTRLGREVALKVLPEAMAQSPERLARFEREAKVLASLNHPHIAALYSFEEGVPEGETGTLQFLTMELVEGEGLDERLERGAIPVDEAVRIARRIAEGMEAAHEEGIVHRDLKPANVRITPKGLVKVLDFGLAKALVRESSSETETVLRESPTITQNMTAAGTLLGTAAYMAPEQVRGQDADKRADIWAFGVVLYEMLAGARGFAGKTVSDTLAAVLRDDLDLGKLPKSVPANLASLLARCLDKDPMTRLRDIGEARIALARTEQGDEAEAVVPEGSARPFWWRALPWVLAAGLGALAVALFVSSRGTPERAESTARFGLDLDRALEVVAISGERLVLSPDGSRLVYVAQSGSQSELFVRELATGSEAPIPGTTGARSPFFSPDGREVAYFAGGELRRIRLDGSGQRTVCRSPSIPFGGSWSDQGFIVMSTGVYRIPVRVDAEGGQPVEVEVADISDKAGNFTWPWVLPDGKAMLVTFSGTVGGEPGPHVFWVSLEDGSRKVLAQGSGARYVAATGHAVFVRGGVLWALPIDPASGERRGPEMDLGVKPRVLEGAAILAFADNGVLVFDASSSDFASNTLVFVDREGETTPADSAEAPFYSPRLSPDESRVAVGYGIAASSDIWVHDLRRRATMRMTFRNLNGYPVWAPSGRQIVYASNRDGMYDLYRKDIRSDRDPERLTTSPVIEVPTSISPDGRTLLYYALRTAATQRDIWKLSFGSEPAELVATRYNERAPVFSPDGGWFAYISDETGIDEIYVRHLEDDGNRWKISSGGGTEPAWNPGGGELFYRQGDTLMSVRITLGEDLDLSAPQALFTKNTFARDLFGPAQYSVTADGERFLMVESAQPEPARLNVVLNWFGELSERAPASG